MDVIYFVLIDPAKILIIIATIVREVVMLNKSKRAKALRLWQPAALIVTIGGE
jgi:uncharacterized SAM-binding protein YcdF (DUF218 family)